MLQRGGQRALNRRGSGAWQVKDEVSRRAKVPTGRARERRWNAGPVSTADGRALASLTDARCEPGTTPALVDVGGRTESLRRSATLRAVLGSDLAAIAISLAAARALTNSVRGGTTGDWLWAAAYAPFVLAVLAIYGLYRHRRQRLVPSFFGDLSCLAHGLIVASLLVLLVAHQANRLLALPNLARLDVVVTALLAMAAVPMTRMLARRFVPGSHRRPLRVLVVGSGAIADSVARRIRACPTLEAVGCADDNVLGESAATEVRLLGGLDDMPTLVRQHRIDHIVVAFTPASDSRLADLLRALSDQVRISVVPRLYDLLTVRSTVDDVAGLPVIDVAPPSLALVDRAVKRTLDVVVSGLALLLVAPLFALIAAAIKVSSPGPVIFRQERAGRSRRAFRIYKFRTMYVGAEAARAALARENEVDGPLFKIKHDPRISPVGGFLRRTSLDELPQLINVFLGDMSLVGPRPFVTAESAGIDGWAARRFEVRPGMTGLWQVSGRNDLPFAELGRLDYVYVASWSLWWDLRILWHTPATVLSSRGAY